MLPETSNDCYLLALMGVPFDEIASAKQIPEIQARQAVESEVARRVDVDDFSNMEDALDYLRLGRLQKGLWANAARGGVSETRQVLSLMEDRNNLKKDDRKKRSLNEAIHDMLHVNQVDMADAEGEIEDE